VADKIKDLL